MRITPTPSTIPMVADDDDLDHRLEKFSYAGRKPPGIRAAFRRMQKSSTDIRL
jgi:hypothetical protein